MTIDEKRAAARAIFCGGRARVGLAPMAGVTDMAFRLLCREMGADFAVSEMISAKGFLLNRRPNENVRALHAMAPCETLGIQLFGSEPDLMAEAARRFAERGCAFIDINMGCPMPKVTGNGEGSALMRTPHLAAEIVRATAEAVDIPVTVKMRAGWDDGSINAVELAQLCQQAGASAICIHARTREQYYSGRADWSIIARAKRALDIPVIGNGDVRSPGDALAMLEATGCDAVAIGRGAQGNPFLFAQVRAALEGEPVPDAPTPRQVLEMLRRHSDMLSAWRGQAVAVRELRKHIAWYLHGMRGSAQARVGLLTLTDPRQVDARLEEYISSL